MNLRYLNMTLTTQDS